MNWIHRLFHYEEHCRTCEVLERQLESITRERDILLNHVIGPKYQPEGENQPEDYKPIKKFVPFRVRQQLAEQESRAQAKILLDKEKEIRLANEKLEQELHLGDENGSSKIA